MKITRRRFLSLSGMLGAGIAVPAAWRGGRAGATNTAFRPMSMNAMKTVTMPGMAMPGAAMPGLEVAPAAGAPSLAFVASPPLAKFARALRGVYPLDPEGIAVAVPDRKISYDRGGKRSVDHYTIDIREYEDLLHAGLTNATTLWGYHSVQNLGDTPQTPAKQRHLGGVIVAERGSPVQITFRNKLPRHHILPVDTTIMGAELAPNRTSVHLHGGEVPWMSDGGPHAWFRPNDSPSDTSPIYGPSVQRGSLNIFKQLNRSLQPGEAEYFYPLNQSARFAWYHDHALGTTRLNAYAGMASGLIIRDDFERSLVRKYGLPDFIERGGRELPIVIQDKIFQDASQDPNYPGVTRTGSLWYPYRYDRWPTAPGGDAGGLPISCVPEMFGDTMLVNGLPYPKLAVEPRRYRLRILNACQARFLNLQLYEAADSPAGPIPNFANAGPPFLVLGTEGGFLARAVSVPSGNRLNVAVDADSGDRFVDLGNPGGSLLTGPAERWDVVVDFSGFAGRSLILYNDTPAPFPGGDRSNDGPTTLDGNGNIVLLNQTMLRIDVGTSVSAPADPPFAITDGFPLASRDGSGVNPALASSWNRITTAPPKTPGDARVRQLTLNELFDEHGRLIQMLGTNQLVDPHANFTLDEHAPGANVGKTTAMAFDAPVTESPSVGDTEIWEIANLTADVHPMHFHLVNVQVLSRARFTGYAFDTRGRGQPTGLGVARGPDSTELGWKDTVRMNPGEVTRVIMRFNLPTVPFDVPKSPRVGGNEYVWHCHILEHEEHDMMRPLVVRGENPTSR